MGHSSCGDGWECSLMDTLHKTGVCYQGRRENGHWVDKGLTLYSPCALREAMSGCAALLLSCGHWFPSACRKDRSPACARLMQENAPPPHTGPESCQAGEETVSARSLSPEGDARQLPLSQASLVLSLGRTAPAHPGGPEPNFRHTPEVHAARSTASQQEIVAICPCPLPRPGDWGRRGDVQPAFGCAFYSRERVH